MLLSSCRQVAGKAQGHACFKELGMITRQIHETDNYYNFGLALESLHGMATKGT